MVMPVQTCTYPYVVTVLLLFLIGFCHHSHAKTSVERRMTDQKQLLRARLNTLTLITQSLGLQDTYFIGHMTLSPRLMGDTHHQLDCGAWPVLKTLSKLKGLLGSRVYRNIAIDCSAPQTQQIIDSLSISKSNASQLELPRINIVLFGDSTESVRHEPRNLLHNIVVINTGNVSDKIVKNTGCEECCLTGTVMIHRLGPRLSSKLGSVSKLCVYRREQDFSLRSIDALNGVHLAIATDEYSPFIKYEYAANGDLILSGYCGEMLQSLATNLKFTYTAVFAPDRRYGSRDKDTQEWNGMVGMVVRKEADMIVAGFTISKARSEAVDFTFPFWEEPSAVVIRYWDKKDSYFYKPFQWQSWLVMFICIGVVAAIAWIFEVVTIKFCKPKSVYKKSTTLIPFTMFSTLMLKGVDGLVSSHAARTLWITFWLISLVIATTYSGNLVAALTTRNIKLPFRTLQGLAEDTEYSLTVGQGNVQYGLMQEAKDGVFAKLWQKIHSRNTAVKSSSVAMTNLVNSSEPWAHTGDKSSIEQFLFSIKRCGWLLLPEEYLPSGFGIALPKGSPYERLISKQLMAMSQYGLFKRWKQTQFLRSQCGYTARHGSDAISTSHIRLLFFVTFGCLGLSSFVLCAEVFMAQNIRKWIFGH